MSPSCDHQCFYSKWTFRHNVPGDNQNNYSSNPNISSNDQGTSHLEEARYAVNDVNLLMTVMADQAIIQTPISLVQTFDGKIKFEDG